MTPAAPPGRSARTAALVVALAAIVLVGVLALRTRQVPATTVGVEGVRTVEIAGPRLTAAPFTPGDALAVRIAEARPVAGGFRYDLRYMAFGPGRHDIGRSLRFPDGTTPEPRPEFLATIPALIPADWSGELLATPPSPIDLRTNHRATMWLAWSAWAALLVPLVWLGHGSRRRVAPVPPPPGATERLKTLLEQASREVLPVERQVEMERLLLACWSQRLNLSDERLSDAVATLRRHPQAGPLWDRVERWLHSRSPSRSVGVVQDLLAEVARWE